MLAGSIAARSVKDEKYDRIQDAEFRVFSQFGEDGIIQYLINKVEIENDTFVEIGVQDYSESNTRFLLTNNNWSGAIFDVGTAHLSFLTRTQLRWRHTIDAYSIRITQENVNETLERVGMAGDIGLFSLDIDGNDYWIVKALDAVSPRILVLEYNSIFGPHHAVTIPYRANFNRTEAHYSNLYFGASLAALYGLATAKGYRLVGSNSTGSNAFFVREDVAGSLPRLAPDEAYVKSRTREARDHEGNNSYLATHEEGLRLVSALPVVDLTADRVITISEFGL